MRQDRIGFKIALPDGVEYISHDDSLSVFDGVIVGMVPGENTISIGAQNTSAPILTGGEICSIGLSVNLNDLQLTAHDIFAKDKNDNDVILDIDIEDLVIFRWTVNGVWT